ncbi:MAG: ImmA/IrrE family metallo-endopeptidase [Candidatus Thiodiazotropha sp. (ex Dulcina madagascariensis)]|nr:ImmA/IrrE family metallo-endopeptidase [Candidatus Thiodiazotropha sp. (ex Dulcina madagascariensis)]
MTLADCFTPQELVEDIFRQCADLRPPIPIKRLAKAAGIIDILPLTKTDKVEGMLVSDEGKNRGVIYYRDCVPPGRQRFTIGHELGHFLLLHHHTRQQCSSSDIKANGDISSAVDFEGEANLFSQQLLMPETFLSSYLPSNSTPNLELIKSISEKFEMSFEAIANRCATLSSNPFALIYSKDGVVRYAWKNKNTFLHWIPLDKGDPLPNQSQAIRLRNSDSTISSTELVSAEIWLKGTQNRPIPELLTEQTYTQEKGYQVTMILI